MRRHRVNGELRRRTARAPRAHVARRAAPPPRRAPSRPARASLRGDLLGARSWRFAGAGRTTARTTAPSERAAARRISTSSWSAVPSGACSAASTAESTCGLDPRVLGANRHHRPWKPTVTGREARSESALLASGADMPPTTRPETETPLGIVDGRPGISAWPPASWARAAASTPMRIAAANATSVTARAPRRVIRYLR